MHFVHVSKMTRCVWSRLRIVSGIADTGEVAAPGDALCKPLVPELYAPVLMSGTGYGSGGVRAGRCGGYGSGVAARATKVRIDRRDMTAQEVRQSRRYTDASIRVPAGSNMHAPPYWMLSPKQPESAMARPVAIEGHSLWRTVRMRGEGLPEEGLGGRDAAVLA
jgi:hypothetical protein